MDTGSLACCNFPSPTSGRGSGWQRSQLLCVRGSSLYGGYCGGAVGFGAGWRAFGCMPSCRSEAGQRHPALLVREKELIECRSFSEASNGSVWKVKSGWSRTRSGGSEPSGLGEQLARGRDESAGKETERSPMPFPPLPHHPICSVSKDIEGP